MTTIKVTYTVSTQWNLDEELEKLGITKEQVKDTAAKYGQLIIIYTDNDGKEKEAYIDSTNLDQYDFKYHDKFEIINE